MSTGRLIINGKTWGEFESAKRIKGHIVISGYESYGGCHTVRGIKQPELNDNQQKYLEQLKRAYIKFGNVYDGIFFSLFDFKKRWGLPAEEFFQVLDTLKVWVLEQEEAKDAN